MINVSVPGWRLPRDYRAQFNRTSRSALQRINLDNLDSRLTLELVDRRHAAVGIDHRLPRLVVVADFDRNLMPFCELPAALFDEDTIERRLAHGRRLVLAVPAVVAVARLECIANQI